MGKGGQKRKQGKKRSSMEDAEGQWRTMEMESNMEIEKIWGQKEEEI